MGMTDIGYTRRTFDDILRGKIQRAKELFGENIDTGDQTVLGKILRINAYDQAISEEEIEAVYYSSKPNSASGQSLDRLVPLGGISRNPATAATYSVRAHGTSGYIIPAGFLVGTDTGLTYWTTGENIIGEDGSCLMNVCCTEAGTIGNVSAGAINKLVNPDANISTAEGVECLSAGMDEESDAELRKRLNTAMSGANGNSIDALVAALLRVPTVRYARVIENDEAAADSDGRPPNSFEAYVQGGEDYHEEIAKAVFAHRSIGIKTVGDVACTVIDVCGNEKIVRFSHTPTTSVTVLMNIKTSNVFPSDGEAQIQANIISHINGLAVGEALILTSLYGCAYKVAGVHEVTELAVSTDGGASYSTVNVPVPSYGVIRCSNVRFANNADSVIIIRKQPESVTVASGDTVVFSVEAEGEGLTYQWEYNTSSSWKNNTQEGNTTAVLSFKAQTYHNGYIYRCKITNASGTVAYTDEVVLTIANAAEASES